MVAQRIKEHLEKNKISLTVLCEQSGMELPYLQKALDGQIHFSIEDYDHICRALGVPYDFFFPR